MKIKLAIIDQDQGYLTRITSAFQARYNDKLEIYSFSGRNVLIDELNGVDVILADESFTPSEDIFAKKCAFAYLVDKQGINQIKGNPAIFKFQKIDVIYKQVINVYAEVAADIESLSEEENNSAKRILFISPGGGAGATTLAAACAFHHARVGRRALYLNLELLGSADIFFAGSGQYDISDIVVALKSRKANLAMKLESCVRQDVSGVFFFSQPKIALDRIEMDTNDIIRLLKELRRSGMYDVIVVDMDFSVNKDMLRIYEQMSAVVWVCDGTQGCNAKATRARECINVLDMMDEEIDLDDICLVYNKYDENKGSVLQNQGFKICGSLPRYHASDDRQLIESLSSSDVFEKIY